MTRRPRLAILAAVAAAATAALTFTTAPAYAADADVTCGTAVLTGTTLAGANCATKTGDTTFKINLITDKVTVRLLDTRVYGCDATVGIAGQMVGTGCS